MKASSSNGRIRLSATLIVKNEANVLGDCLRSIHGVADEIVVVDTGSTDRTRDIARNLGARLFDVPWTNDFAAARNRALDQARGEWILYIDADETLRACDANALFAQLSEPRAVGYQVLLHARPGFTPYWEMRLFRNHPTIRFRGVIHENIWPALDAYRVRQGGYVARSDLVLDHRGYEGDQQHKHYRNLPLLSRALRADPTRVFVLCHLANVCVALGKDALAKRAWHIALERVRDKRGRGLIPEDSLPYVSLVARGLEAGDDVTALLAEGEARFPSNLQLRWLHGMASVRGGDYAGAIGAFEQLLGAGESDRSVGYDTSLFGVRALEALATCHFKLERYAEAADFFERAAAAAPESVEYRVKLALARRLAQGADAGPKRSR